SGCVFVRLNCQHLESQGFNNVPHFHNFMHYLLRTDNNQNWTNENTAFNMYCFRNSEGDFVFDSFHSLSDLKSIKNEMYGVLMPVIRSNGINSLANDILYYSIVDKEGVTEKDIAESFIGVVQQSEKNLDNTVYVLHADQDALHVHSVFGQTDKIYEKW